MSLAGNCSHAEREATACLNVISDFKCDVQEKTDKNELMHNSRQDIFVIDNKWMHAVTQDCPPKTVHRI